MVCVCVRARVFAHVSEGVRARACLCVHACVCTRVRERVRVCFSLSPPSEFNSQHFCLFGAYTCVAYQGIK